MTRNYAILQNLEAANQGILGEYNTLDVINPNGLKTTRLAHVCTWDVPPNKMAKLCKVINYECPIYLHINHVAPWRIYLITVPRCL